jgi:sugar phosphate isomerase/epimerase
MILYDKGDPIEALKLLAPWIKHVHIKDAVKSEVKGGWGSEVPWGEGQVGAEKFMETLNSISYRGAVAVEREAGEKRIEDIKSAIKILTAN